MTCSKRLLPTTREPSTKPFDSPVPADLGRTTEADVFADAPPTLTLVEAMRLAADRDLVARQYTNNFADVFAGTAALD